MKVHLCLRDLLGSNVFFLSSIKVLYGCFLCKKDLLKQEKRFNVDLTDGAKTFKIFRMLTYEKIKSTWFF